MADLKKPYDCLEKKRDDEHIDSVFLFSDFHQKNGLKHGLRLIHDGK